MIRLRRVYAAPQSDEGQRFLVDRLWPRGVKKESLGLVAWSKAAAPSDELRHAFHAHPEGWGEFCARYTAELDRDPAAWQPLLEAARLGTITLLYAARDVEHNNAVALKQYLERRLAAKY